MQDSIEDHVRIVNRPESDGASDRSLPARVPLHNVPNVELRSRTTTDPLAQFQLAVTDIFTVEPIEPRSPASEDYASAWHLGAIMIGRFAAGAMAFTRTRELAAASGLDHLLVQVYTRGSFDGVADDRAMHVEPGDICVFDLTRTLRTRATAYANISMLIPRSRITAQIAYPSELHGLVVPAADPLAGLLAGYITGLVERVATLDHAQAQVAGHATVALLSAMLARFAIEDTPYAATHSPLRAAMQHIDAMIHDPALDAAAIVAAIGASRARLYRLFEPMGGVARYIRQRRLAGAALSLADPELRTLRVGDIGFRWGFANASSFARAFHAAFGVSASEARARGVAPARAMEGMPIGDAERLAAWMRTLRG